jgi:hypothetical protein
MRIVHPHEQLLSKSTQKLINPSPILRTGITKLSRFFERNSARQYQSQNAADCHLGRHGKFSAIPFRGRARAK